MKEQGQPSEPVGMVETVPQPRAYPNTTLPPVQSPQQPVPSDSREMMPPATPAMVGG